MDDTTTNEQTYYRKQCHKPRVGELFTMHGTGNGDLYGNVVLRIECNDKDIVTKFWSKMAETDGTVKYYKNGGMEQPWRLRRNGEWSTSQEGTKPWNIHDTRVYWGKADNYLNPEF